MQDFIVLGLIPGTNIQIGFFGWLIIATLLFAARIILRRTSKVRTTRFIVNHIIYIILSHKRLRSAQVSH